MPSPNIIQFSLDETYRKKLADLAKNGESIGLIAKKLIIEILDREEVLSQKLVKDDQRVDTLEQSIKSIGSRIDSLEQSIKSIGSRIDSLEQSKEDTSLSLNLRSHQPEPQTVLSDAEVAKRIGVNHSTANRWRTGIRKMSPEVLSQLEAIGVMLSNGKWVKKSTT